MRNTLRTAVVATTAAGLICTAGGVAFADDCFNASRSATGSTAAAAHSSNWWSLSEMLTQFIGLSPDQVAAVMQVVNNDPRIPSNLTLFFMPSQSGHVFELAQGQPLRLSVNGKGIDHSDDYPGLWDALNEDLETALS